MGLLDVFSTFIKTPEGMGLLSATFGGLAGAQRGAPLNSLGRAGMSGLMGYSNAQDQQVQLQQADQTKKTRQFQIEQEQRRQEALKKLSGSVSPEMAPWVDIAPEAVFKSMFKDPENGGTPFFNFLPTDKGYAVGDARTGKITPASFNGQPFIRATDSPDLQARITGAKDKAASDVKVGAENTKAIKTSNQLLSVAKEAETLLQSPVTHSGFGSILDAGGRTVGITSEAAKNSAKLETLSGWMVANVPRMEGPQSNFDVENYKTMAGKVGDRTIPVAERKAALNELIGLQEKYKQLNQGATEPTDQQKTASMADIAATAKASGRTTAEVTAAMKAKGYVIK